MGKKSNVIGMGKRERGSTGGTEGEKEEEPEYQGSKRRLEW